MPEFLLFGAGALLLVINTHATVRVLASQEPVWRKGVILWMVWLIPLLGALLARVGLPKPSSAQPVSGGTPSHGFSADAAPQQVTLREGPAFPLREHMSLYNGLPLPDWQALIEWAASMNDADLQRAALEQGKRGWLLHLRDALGPHFRLHESESAYVLSSLEDVVATATAAYVTSTRKRIPRVLAGLARIEAHDKSILIVMDDDDTYYDYVSSYYPEGGEFAFSGGMFIDAGCPHFLAKRADLAAIEPVIAHEMTHSALSHLKLPRWLDEGLAVNTERRLTGAGVMPLGERHQLRRSHLKFWDDARIQEFWSGASFFRPDAGNRLSYELARIFVEQMGQNWALFTRFASNAKREDGGAEAAREVYDMDLGTYACILMEREPDPRWAPDPQSWVDQAQEEESPA
jgi:hypothetical protein